MLRPGTRYENRKDEFAPFDKILDPNEEMREDIAELVGLTARAGKIFYIVVNNKAEGSAPLTVRVIAIRIGSDS